MSRRERPKERRPIRGQKAEGRSGGRANADGGAFPVLRQEFPELVPVITKLEEDHVLVASILQRLNQLLDELPNDPDASDTMPVGGAGRTPC